MTDYTFPPATVELAQRVRAFVIDKIIPFEKDTRLTQHGPTDDLRNELVALARAEGLLTPQAPVEFGGMGFDHATQAAVFEAAGWSTLGPIALNCAAPDEGNMYLLGRIARPDQIEQFLRPVIAGHRRSVFAMTEPGGAGSDPGQLKTTAVFNGNDYEISGLKWLITGANGAKSWIIMARVPENPHGPSGPTLFLCEGDTPGIHIDRVMDSMDRNYVEGHAVVRFDGLRLGPSQVLGEVGSALRYAQMRLAPARLTHCMRWLGAAARAQRARHHGAGAGPHPRHRRPQRQRRRAALPHHLQLDGRRRHAAAGRQRAGHAAAASGRPRGDTQRTAGRRALRGPAALVMQRRALTA